VKSKKTGETSMGIFDKIKDAIFGRAEATEIKTTPAAAAAPAAPAASPAASPTPAAPTPVTSAAPTPSSPIDVAPILDAAAAKSGQKLDWRKSIVDLLKALDIDSSLAARKELADELGYTGAKDGSAEMNIWLHKAFLKKLSENGGKVPAELLD
jgi:3-oxoacyl-ACP reductase-like protein